MAPETSLMDRSVNRSLLNSSADDLRRAGHIYDKIVVGAAAFRRVSSPASSTQVLLLKRAANETYYPNVFELPSGKVDATDTSLSHALSREVMEESGLAVKAILAQLQPMIYTTAKTVTDEAGKEATVSKSAIQYNFVVLLSDDELRINIDEHSEGGWFTEEESSSLDITPSMRTVIQEAFVWASTPAADRGELPSPTT